MDQIPFNRPYVPSEASRLLRDCLSSGHLSGDGRFSKSAVEVLSSHLTDAKVLLTPSGTHALELALWLLDLQSGDEVIVPSYTFSSTANAILQAGGRPVFVDVDPKTLNLDESRVREALGPRTRAIVPIHYAGIAANMEALRSALEGTDVVIVEDAAHALGGMHLNRPLGTLGCMSALSFHETKNFQCGEGGALVVSDPSYFERAEILREKGTNRSRFFRGEVDKYTWVDRGSSWLLAEPLAALLGAQLDMFNRIQDSRETAWLRYMDGLADWSLSVGAQLPFVPNYAVPAWHIFFVRLPSHDEQVRFIDHMKGHGVQCTFHYQPLHSSAAGTKFGRTAGSCHVTEEASATLVRLPLWSVMPSDAIKAVLKAVRMFS